VAGDKVAIVHAHRADLVLADPDSGVRRSVSRQPEPGAEAVDDGLK